LILCLSLQLFHIEGGFLIFFFLNQMVVFFSKFCLNYVYLLNHLQYELIGNVFSFLFLQTSAIMLLLICMTIVLSA